MQIYRPLQLLLLGSTLTYLPRARLKDRGRAMEALSVTLVKPIQRATTRYLS